LSVLRVNFIVLLVSGTTQLWQGTKPGLHFTGSPH